VPRPSSAVGTDGLPLWDTFEAIFFLGAGLSVGLVLGFLFPSLWRSFRRRFRNTSRFLPGEFSLEDSQKTVLNIMGPEDEDGEIESTTSTFNIQLTQAFVIARGQYQEGKLRDAVKTYLEILGNVQVSKTETNRALLELSQCYLQLGLQQRSFDLAFELLNRKPRNEKVFEHLLAIVTKFQLLEKIPGLVEVYKGDLPKLRRLRITHAYCQLGEKLLELSQDNEGLLRAREALRWDISSARARILLWTATSKSFWFSGGSDARNLWIALATDLEARVGMGMESNVSPAAGAQHLAALFAHLSALPEASEVYPTIQAEFEKIIGISTASDRKLRELERIVAYGCMELMRLKPFHSDSSLQSILRLLVPQGWTWLLQNSEQMEASLLGYSSHRCGRCDHFYESFTWECTKCGHLEILSPAVRNENKN